MGTATWPSGLVLAFKRSLPALLVLLQLAAWTVPGNAHGWLANPPARNVGQIDANAGNGLGATSSVYRCGLPYVNCPGNPGERSLHCEPAGIV